MELLLAADLALLRLINQSLANPFFDWLMPVASGTALLWPAIAVLAVAALGRGGRKGRVFVVVFALVGATGDPLVCNHLKKAIQRPRPFVEHADIVTRVGRGGSYAMPSGHSFNWGVIVAVSGLFYRRALWAAVPLGFLVGFSRVYNGVHYPSDVLAGWALGALYAALIVLALDRWVWPPLARRWWPAAYAELPSFRAAPRALTA